MPMTGGTKAFAAGIPAIIAVAGVISNFQWKERIPSLALKDKPGITEMAVVSTDPKPADVEKPVPADNLEKSVDVATNEKSVTADEATTVPDPATVPLDLTKHYAMHASAFDKAKRYPWKMVPRGAQTYANVPLQIDGAIFLWGESNFKRGLAYPEKVAGIEVNQKFETLYVYHAAFFEGEKGDPVFDLVFQYQDGTSATDTIRSRDDVRDWYGTPGETMNGPSSPRSVLAWNEEVLWNDQKHPLRYCLTAIMNPHPELEVTSIDLISSKTQTAGCILAMTAGKSSLMHRTNNPE